MRILHINTLSNGGAFNGAYRVHCALLKMGIKSKLLVLEDSGLKSNQLKEVYVYNHPQIKTNILNRFSTLLGKPVTARQKRKSETKNLFGKFEIISFPFSDYDITQSPLYQEAEIINLHWVGDFLDYTSFFRKNTKPVIFTLRDSNPFLGIFHLQLDWQRNQGEWGQKEKKHRQLKLELIQKAKCKIKIAGISNWITNEARQSEILNRFEARTIHNCIDTELFKPIDKKEARNRLQLDHNKIIFSFVVDSIDRINKGHREVVQAFNSIDNPNIELLLIGDKNKQIGEYKANHRHLGYLNPEQLRIVHSAADAFIFSTKEESLGNVMLEAMACGIPVIGTPVGGLLDVIKPEFNGLLTKDVSFESLRETIERFITIKSSFNSDAIRNYIKDNFSEKLIARKYISLYEEMLIK